MNILSTFGRWLLAVTLAVASLHALADAGEMRAQYAQLREQLQQNPYGRPLFIESSEQGDTLKGDVYAVLEHSFDTLSGALKDPDDWCDILLLPFNTKYCRANGQALIMRIGRKVDQPLDQAYRLDLAMRQVAARSDYFESRLSANEGPVGTRDYRIVLSAIPLDGKRTFMHLSYSYGYGGMGRFAMQMYLNTAGASKVGFSVAGRDANGQPVYTGGVRGAIERNVMRYYLAVDAHLASLSAPPEQQLDKRLQTWFNETERYARQLHEMDRGQYMALKRSEYERQHTQALAN